MNNQKKPVKHYPKIAKDQPKTVEEVVQDILQGCNRRPHLPKGVAFAPSNIAVCKYWGKRDHVLNLPVTSSLSISLDNLGATTSIEEIDSPCDQIVVNNQALSNQHSQHVTQENKPSKPESDLHNKHAQKSEFEERLIRFLDCFRPTFDTHYRIETNVNIPIAAGLASSASGFAALVLALNRLYHWDLSSQQLSVLARLGSGSACRSLWHGFVEWECGEDVQGRDSHGLLVPSVWKHLCIGLLIVNQTQKSISSRLAMQRTQETSIFYEQWPQKVSQDLDLIKSAIQTQNFTLLGETAESNAIAMHALMLTARPSISYFTPETIACIQKVHRCRLDGLEIYYTQDAGPNLKLLFLSEDSEAVQKQFPDLIQVMPFKQWGRVSNLDSGQNDL